MPAGGQGRAGGALAAAGLRGPKANGGRDGGAAGNKERKNVNAYDPP